MKTLITKIKKFLLSIPDKLKPFYFDKQAIEFKRTGGLFLIVIFFFSISSFYLGKTISDKNKKEVIGEYKDEEKSIIIKDGDKFSEDKLILFLKELNVKFPEIIYSQAKLESANFSSSLMKENNNLFGMRSANSRPNLQISTQSNYAVYNSWRQSVEDYILFYCCYLRDLKTKEQYYEYIEKHYSETPGYSEQVRTIEKEYFKKLKGLTGNSYEIVSK